MTVHASSIRVARLDSGEWVDVGAGSLEFTHEPALDEPMPVPTLAARTVSVTYRLDRRETRTLARLLSGWYRHRARIITRRKYVARRRRS